MASVLLSCERPLGRFSLLLCAGLLGCGGGSLPEQASPERAKQALRNALDAWQKDEPLEALAERTPAIYFNDHRARDGMRLLSYELEDGHEFFGQSVRVRAKALVRQKD